jgi:hypothetical protein
MVLVRELVDPPTLYQVWSGWFWYCNYSFSVLGLVWMVLVLELVDPPILY